MLLNFIDSAIEVGSFRSIGSIRRVYWGRLPFCNYEGGAAFPSKCGDKPVGPDDESLKYNDGDSVLLNGLTCSVGDDRGCDAVKRSQAIGRPRVMPARPGDKVNQDLCSYSEKSIAKYENKLKQARAYLAHINAAITIFEASGDPKGFPAYVDLHRMFKYWEAIGLLQKTARTCAILVGFRAC